MAWETDKLDRRSFGTFVKDLLVSRYKAKESKNLIVNLDASWGQGKTFFLKNLAEDLKESGHVVAQVNAWQDDRSDDPLLTVIAAITENISEKMPPKGSVADHLDKAKKAIAPVTMEVSKQIGTHLLKLGLGISVDKLIDVAGQGQHYEADDDAIGQGTDRAIEALSKAYVSERLERHKTDKLAIETFRHEIAKAISTLEIDGPMFVFIDELDRCRPLYAVRMLEDLKHIFEIKGIVFLVGTDSVQLSHSIKALYGSEFDSASYLRRFFDRVIVFPPVTKKSYVEELLSALDVDLEQDSIFQERDRTNLGYVVSLVEAGELTNRDINQFLEILATFIHSWNEKIPIYLPYLLRLCYDYFEDPRQFANEDKLRRSVFNWYLPNYSNRREEINTELVEFQTVLSRPLREVRTQSPNHHYLAKELSLSMDQIHANQEHRSIAREYRSRIIAAARYVLELRAE